MSTSRTVTLVAPMNLPFFGVAPSQPIAQAGGTTSCAVNAGGQIVEIHLNTDGESLNYCAGNAKDLALDWAVTDGAVAYPGDDADTGYNPAVVIDNDGYVLEAHDSGGINASLYYWVGQVTQSQGQVSGINWTAHDKYTKGYTPSMCINRNGAWVECHASTETGVSAMWTTVGTFKDGGFSYQKSVSMNNNGVNPSIAVNNNNIVVQAHSNNLGTLYYSLGVLNVDSSGNPTGISWTSDSSGAIVSTSYTSGANPSVVITDDNFVYEVHAALFTGPHTKSINRLWQLAGQVQLDSSGNPISITWFTYLGTASQTSYEYDDGSTPWIACNAVLSGSSVNALALQTHIGKGPIYGNAALVFDHRLWMRNHRLQLRGKTLASLVVPGSHDSSMYLGGPQGGTLKQLLGKTQSLNVLGQLMAGVRWFDLRVAYVEQTLASGTVNSSFYTHHHNIPGPPLGDVLDDIRSFMINCPGEFVLLKFSHYGYVSIDDNGTQTTGTFTQDMLNDLCATITTSLGDWACPTPTSGRLAGQALSTLWGVTGTVLMVCDGNADAATPLMVDRTAYPSVFNYRDWNAADPQNGDLNVFDFYSDAVTVPPMISSLKQDKKFTGCAMPQGQKPKFEGGTVSNWTGAGSADWSGFDGVCENTDPQGNQVPCDLFLLSWTLTTDPLVFAGAHAANSLLAGDVTSTGPNAKGQYINILYTDYVQWSRAADVACLLNGLVGTGN